MIGFISRRFLQAIPVLFTVLLITFVLMHAAPGGPFSSEKAIPKETKHALEVYYHLDKPLPVQFFIYMKNLVHGDFGPSFKLPGQNVADIIAQSFPVSLELGFYALIVAMVMGSISGVLAALKRNTLYDYIPMSLSMFGICVPALLLGPLLALVFGIWFDFLPVAGWSDYTYKILPAFTLGNAYSAYIARLGRSGMIEVLHQDFIRTARAKGATEWRVIVRHALKGGMIPVVSFLGPAAAGLITGSFVVETIFQVPGLGRYFVQAASNRDYTMIMGTTVFFAALIVLFIMISDIVLVWINPKLK